LEVFYQNTRSIARDMDAVERSFADFEGEGLYQWRQLPPTNAYATVLMTVGHFFIDGAYVLILF